MQNRNHSASLRTAPIRRHCEERSDVAICTFSTERNRGSIASYRCSHGSAQSFGRADCHDRCAHRSRNDAAGLYTGPAMTLWEAKTRLPRCVNGAAWFSMEFRIISTLCGNWSGNGNAFFRCFCGCSSGWSLSSFRSRTCCRSRISRHSRTCCSRSHSRSRDGATP